MNGAWAGSVMGLDWAGVGGLGEGLDFRSEGGCLGDSQRDLRWDEVVEAEADGPLLEEDLGWLPPAIRLEFDGVFTGKKVVRE